jgi:diaminopimelate decarboxylase
MFNNLHKKIQNLDTPYYIYNIGLIERNIITLLRNFSHGVEIFYAVKANTPIAILKIVRERNIGAEVVSPGEIYVCLKAGFNPHRILYNNIARKEDEIMYAIKSGVIFFNFESIDQAFLLEKCAKNLRRDIKIFVRINPGIFPKTHPHLSTGSSWSKFGVEMDELHEVYNLVKRFKFAKLVGIHCHIGSQILSPSPFIKAAKKVSNSLEFFTSRRVKIEYVNFGGGFGIPYRSSDVELNLPPIVKEYHKVARRFGVKIFLEPGRFLVGNAGFIVTRVISVKKRNGIPLYIIDAGMTENLRPALYGAYHHIESLFKENRKKRRARVAGPLCENSDEFGLYDLPELKIGDVLLIHNCGAYTRTMASNYNGRLLPAEYTLSQDSLITIRERQRLEDLIENERY